MARMRYIKPETWTDGNMIRLSPFARLLFIGSWNFALCDRGHLPDDPVQLKLQILPADDVDPVALVDELLALGRLVRVEGADGQTYLQVLRLERHQKVDKRWSPRCPACGTDSAEPQPSTPELSETPRASTELPETLPKTPKEGRGGDRRGEERRGGTPPASTCPQHRDHPDPPACGKCRNYRIAREHWEVEQVEQGRINREAIRACSLCDGEGQRLQPGTRTPLAPYERCDHRPLRSVS